MLELSPFQPVERDFAFVVEAGVKAADIVRAAQSVDRKLIADVSVFDVYEGKGIEAGKKSIAIAVTMQPRDKTMTDAEIDALGQQDRRRSGKAHRRRAAGLSRQQIRKRKAVALDRRADATAILRVSIGPAETKVWNSPFSPHGSTPAGKVGEQVGVEAPAGEIGRQFLQVDHGQMRLDAAVDHRARQAPRSACAKAETPA